MQIFPSQYLTSGVDKARYIFKRAGGVRVTFGAYREDVGRLCQVLGQDSRGTVLLYSQDDYEFAVGLLASAHAGKRVLLPPDLCRGTRESLLGEDVILLTAGQEEEAVSILGHEEGVVAVLEPFDPHALELCFFTSGSTGKSKLIQRNWAALEAELKMLAAVLPHEEDIDMFSTVSFHHAFGIAVAFLYPLSRGYLVDADSFVGMEAFLKRVAGSNGRPWMVSSPAFLSLWAENLTLYPHSKYAERIFSAGAPLPMDAACQITKGTDARIFEIFGSSEAGVTAWRYPAEDAWWRPFPGVELLPKDGEDAGVCIYSPACGAAGMSDLGDAIEKQPDCRFRLMPRVDRIVKLADKRVSLPQVEAYLAESPLVDEAYVLVLDSGYRKVLAPVVCPSARGWEVLQQQGYAEMQRRLRQGLSKHLEAVFLPRRWRFVGSLPRTPEGKIQRCLLERLFATRQHRPLVKPLELSDNKIRMEVLFVRDANYFSGHFPQFALLPGVIQLQLAADVAEQYWQFSLAGVSRCKFCAMVQPGQRGSLELTRRPDSCICKLFAEEKLCFQATLKAKA